MRKVTGGPGSIAGSRMGMGPSVGRYGFLNTVLALVIGAGTILSLAGCRSRYDHRADRVLYPDARGGTYYPPGYPVGSQPPRERDSRHRNGARERREARQAPTGPASFWNGDHLSGDPSIRIDLRTQRAYFYKGNELAGVSPVSTGRPGYETPAGSFRITQKSPAHRSNLYGDYVDAAGNIVLPNVDIRRDKGPPGTTFRGASMPHFLRFNDAVGMHGGYLPGYPASSGCVRLPDEMARHFFANAPTGTPVVVVR